MSRKSAFDDDAPQVRRHFFGALFEKIVGPVANVVEKKANELDRLFAEPRPAAPLSMPLPPVLRPPGALPEAQFVEACQRSGECVRACPAQAILPIEAPAGSRLGTPQIVPETQACVVCDSLACMSACPSGALVPTPRQSIRMGRALVAYDLCLRADGEDCRVCMEKCPFGEEAIGLDDVNMVAIRPGCVGCGLCVMHCPAPINALSVQCD